MPEDRTGLQALRRNSILDTLRTHGACTRADLQRHTALPRATLAHLLAELLAHGEVALNQETDTPRLGAGRPAQRYHLLQPRALYLVASCSAFGANVALTDAGGTLSEIRSEAFTGWPSPQESLRAAAAVARKLLDDAGLEPSQTAGAAVAIPAPLTPGTGDLGSEAVHRGWAGFNPGAEFGRALGRPATAENDANLAALGELRHGAGRGIDDFIYLRIHHGLGAALVLDGELYRGASGHVGEIGHVRVRDFGPLCYCGGQGCLSPLVTSRAVAAMLRPIHGPLTLQDVIRLGLGNDTATRKALIETGRLIGRTLGNLCSVIDPAAVIVGGGLVEAGPHLLEGLEQALRSHTHPTVAEHVRIVPSELGKDAELLGAAQLLAGDHQLGQ
ncbi:ROK family protein [Actinospica durhamensis]|uniref:ROK family protein n=1 Tax=Actinospica durhamensis TaxID=1508375 RepID=A0A941ILW0_9ACTN|nr:ROK family protein [Actinospica durhamensis]MBR7833460.1 ROK family protein [Actinospica durhamensis]